MAEENFLVNPPHRLRRKRNPIGETLVTIGLNPSRRNPMTQNPWYGHSEGHRIAALMRWGKISRGKIRKRRKHVVKHKRKHVVKHRRRAKGFIGPTMPYSSFMASMGRGKGGYKPESRSSGRGLSFMESMGRGRIGLNPAKRRKHMAKRHRSRKSNTWFGQPRRHRRASKKGWRKGHMLLMGTKRRRRVRHANPMVSANPRRRHHVRHRRRRNPALGMATFGQFTSSVMNVREWGPLAITGGLSAITGAVVPGMLGVYNPWMKYGVQTAVAIGGGIVVEKVVDRRHGQAWMIVGVAMVGYQLLKEFVLQPYFPQFAVGLGDYQSYYPESNADDVSQRIDAFPSAMGAFPSAMSAYPGVGEVGAYPYDGAGY